MLILIVSLSIHLMRKLLHNLSSKSSGLRLTLYWTLCRFFSNWLGNKQNEGNSPHAWISPLCLAWNAVISLEPLAWRCNTWQWISFSTSFSRLYGWEGECLLTQYQGTQLSLVSKWWQWNSHRHIRRVLHVWDTPVLNQALLKISRHSPEPLLSYLEHLFINGAAHSFSIYPQGYALSTCNKIDCLSKKPDPDVAYQSPSVLQTQVTTLLPRVFFPL